MIHPVYIIDSHDEWIDVRLPTCAVAVKCFSIERKRLPRALDTLMESCGAPHEIIENGIVNA